MIITMITFEPSLIKTLYKPPFNSSKGDNGQVIIIGGSKLFHGAPLFALTIASKINDMVFFASPEPSISQIANNLKSKLLSFIWVPWDDLEKYIEKSDSVLIGSGLMRYGREQGDNLLVKRNKLDNEGQETREITRDLLLKFPNKKWVIDAGSLQVMEPEWIPKDSIITPNKKEYEILFGVSTREQESLKGEEIQKNAKKYECIIVLKGPTTLVVSSDQFYRVEGGNPGLTKGGSGDIEAGLTVSLLANNDPMLAACAGSYIVKKAAEELHKNVGPYYSSDDLAGKVPEVLFELTK